MSEGVQRIGGYEVHPAAALLPLMSDGELDELAADIKVNGLDQPIVLFEGKVLDGRNRLLACERAGVPAKTKEWQPQDGADVARLVISANLHRRHLSPSQKAALAAELLPMFEAEARERQREGARRGGLARGDAKVPAPGRKPPDVPRSAAAAAAEARGASARQVERAKAVKERDPALFEKVKKGDTTLKRAEKDLKRAEQLQQIREYVPPQGKKPVIVRDPAWPYEDQLVGDGARGGTPYPQATIEEICAQELPAAEDCVLWLWTTNAHLLDGSALQVLAAWGFTPKTMLTWVKDRMGAGRWLRGQTEHCVLAVKGSPRVDLTNQTTVLHAPRGEHSAKPGEFYALVEQLCPARPLFEMDARRARPGWECSGSELPAAPRDEDGRHGAPGPAAVPDAKPVIWWLNSTAPGDNLSHAYPGRDAARYERSVTDARRSLCGVNRASPERPGGKGDRGCPPCEQMAAALRGGGVAKAVREGASLGEGWTFEWWRSRVNGPRHAFGGPLSSAASRCGAVKRSRASVPAGPATKEVCASCAAGVAADVREHGAVDPLAPAPAPAATTSAGEAVAPFFDQALDQYRHGLSLCPWCGIDGRRNNPEKGGVGWVYAGKKGGRLALPICSPCKLGGRPPIYVAKEHHDAWALAVGMTARQRRAKLKADSSTFAEQDHREVVAASEFRRLAVSLGFHERMSGDLRGKEAACRACKVRIPWKPTKHGDAPNAALEQLRQHSAACPAAKAREVKIKAASYRGGVGDGRCSSAVSSGPGAGRCTRDAVSTVRATSGRLFNTCQAHGRMAVRDRVLRVALEAEP